MSSSNKESKSFQEMLKQFFRHIKNNPGAFKRNELILTEDSIKDISPGTSLPQRTKAIYELNEKLVKNKFEELDISKLYSCIEDLLTDQQNRESRHLAYSLLSCICRHQAERLDILRARFFKLIQNSEFPEDVVPRFELLIALTSNGKNILNFEEEIGPFLLQCITEVTGAGKTLEYLTLLVNVIKFHPAYIDEEIITGFVAHVTTICCNSANQQAIVLECLQVLDTVVCYSILPNESLATFIAALCRTVNHEVYCQSSWKIMRNLLGTHLGHASLLTMCRALQEPALANDPGLLRGAVFHVNMGLWGRHRITSLQCSPTAVLPSFLQALKCNHPLVMYEVMLSIQMLINKFGYELQDPVWDCIFDIIEAIIKYMETSSKSNPNSQVAIHLHETLCNIEQLMEIGSYKGSIKRIFALIERCAPMRPEASVLRLITYLATAIVPTRYLWLSKLNQLLERYFKHETRTNVRLKALDVLNNVVKLNRTIYEDELMERIVVVHLQNITSDTDVIVRESAANFLANLCKDCESKRCLELLDILDKILKRPFEVYGDYAVPAPENDLIDVKAAVVGLINAFIIKIFRLPSSHCLKIYEILVNHLRMHYAKPHVFENTNCIRYKIFETFLKIRANSAYHIGYPENFGTVVITNRTGIRYSPYIVVDNSRVNASNTVTNSPPPGSPANLITQQSLPHNTGSVCVTHVSLKRGFKCFIMCLAQEKDWEVLHLILQELSKVMQNKTLILSRQGNNDIDLLANALYDMIADKSLGLPETLKNTSSKLSKHDFHSHVLPVLGCLASYHTYLESNIQKKIVLSLIKFGLQSRCSRQCITALTTCTLEMRDVMVKLLPEVLLDLSKISATVHIAIPILEFLSTLTRLPDIFSSFVGDQYMSVFAISLPYTNPFKYNHYTVSLAHHVIAVWFLKCRLPFRRDFVKFITKGLKTNVIVPFEEGQLFKSDLVSMNEDSSNRKRSSSLTEQGSRGRRDRTSAPPAPVTRLDARAALDLRPPIDEALNTFHTELTETCIDFMARYTFSPCSALPKRFPTADFLLSGGQSMTWLLGNMLITVTTSGCSTKALKNGLCDKCWSICKSFSTTTPDTERYGKSSFNRSTSGEDSQSSRITRQSSSDIQKSSQESPVDEKREFISTNTLSSIHNSDNLEQQLPNKLHQLINADQTKNTEKLICACWCQGWAEICIRRPTGDISWVMRIQNQISSQNLHNAEFPLNELSTLYLPSLDRQREDRDTHRCSSNVEIEIESSIEKNVNNNNNLKTNSVSGPINIPGSPLRQSPSRQNSQESVDDDYDGDIYDDNLKSRNPVRRSNSSPEMSASWKNPFLTQEKIDKMNVFSGDNEGPEMSQKKNKSNYCKDMRVSCEAIPEEMSGLGTTPPTNEIVDTTAQHHFHSYHSYPGTAPQGTETESTKVSATVPTSPITLIGTALNQSQDLFKNVIKSNTKQHTENTDSNDKTTHNRPKNLPVLNHPLTAKPPQSPTQTSPRLQRHLAIDRDNSQQKNVSPLIRSNTLDKQSKFGHSTENVNSDSRNDLSSMPIRRDRGHTISVMSHVRKPRIRRTNSPRTKEVPKSGINPSFVFLQLYHSATFGMNEKPLLVGQNQAVQRGLQLLDKIPPYEIHKVGVLYVGPGQCNNQVAILRNKYGSLRYVQFLQKLGTMIRLQDMDPQVWIGGLEQNGKDGKFAYVWYDDVMHMMFHVATLMPNHDNDPSCNEKIKHIGNDFVTIVYNESGDEYNMNTIKTQFNFSCIVIEPLDHNTNRVTVKAREDLAEHIGHSEPKIISDQNLSILTRQLALHANLASLISSSLKSSLGNVNVYASNWLERLRHIKRLRSKVLQELADEKNSNGSVNSPSDTETSIKRNNNKLHMDDFTEYT